MSFDQNKYKQQYNRDHYKTFKVDLRTEELEKLNEMLKKEGMTKAQVLREAMKDLEERINSNNSLEK